MNPQERYRVKPTQTYCMDCFSQMLHITSDGDLISKDERDKLYKNGMIIKRNGRQVISAKGIEYLYTLGYIRN